MIKINEYIKEEKLIIKKIAQIKKLYDIIPQFSSIQAFYSLKDEENIIEINIKDVCYSTKNEGKYVFLEQSEEDGFHDRLWICRSSDPSYDKITLYESWLENIRDTVVFYDKEGNFHFNIDSSMLDFIKKVNQIVENQK